MTQTLITKRIVRVLIFLQSIFPSPFPLKSGHKRQHSAIVFLLKKNLYKAMELSRNLCGIAGVKLWNPK